MSSGGMAMHILVVDDDADFMKLISHGLRANGFECSEASPGLDALERARSRKHDTGVLDIM